MRAKNVLMTVAIAMATLVACTPEDGDTGPVGPVGPEGPPGVDGDGAGTVGPAGEDGKDGAANITSKTYNIAGTDWTGAQIRSEFIVVPELTDKILTEGTVQSFITFSTSTTDASWNPMPYRNLALVAANTVESLNITNRFVADTVFLTYYWDDLQNRGIQNSIYRLVMIPDADRIEGVDYNNWEEIQMVHGVNDLGVMQQ